MRPAKNHSEEREERGETGYLRNPSDIVLMLTIGYCSSLNST